MLDRKDLEGKLSRANDWVREEFGFIADVAAALGCESRIEGGPGLVFHLNGRVVVKAHPKQYHIGVGLPEWMSEDVEEWTAALRAQRGDAWFNYQPGVADRDTLEILFGTSVQAISPARPPTQAGRRRAAASTGPDDDADLELILAVLRAFHRHATTAGSLKATKPLREILFFQWEKPRLQGGKYSRWLPHSPAARDRRRQNPNGGGLVYEHVVPIAEVIHELLENLPSDEQALRRVLERTSDRVIVTREEDASLTAAGYQRTLPDRDDPWSKYREALGLQRSDFAPFDGKA